MQKKKAEKERNKKKLPTKESIQNDLTKNKCMHSRSKKEIQQSKHNYLIHDLS